MNFGQGLLLLKRNKLTKRIIIIAEAGVNHNGDLNKALDLIQCAADAGADYVKFQTFKTEKLVQKSAQKASYQVTNTQEAGSQFEMLKKLEIPFEWYDSLIQKARENNIGFLSTGFDEESIDFLDSLGCDFYKIPSGEITNKPYLEHIAKKGKAVIISTGMSTMQDIANAIEVFTSNGISKSDITVLHCNTEYPTPMKDVNLRAMSTIAEKFNVSIGYSDHTLGIEVSTAAVALGARVIEKHFTLDKSLPGPDHRASLSPKELKDLVSAIRNVEQAISGTGIKEPSQSERQNMVAARKSIHFRIAKSAGDIIERDDLIMLRPGDGISPMDMDKYIGKTLIKDKLELEMLTTEDCE